MRYTDIEAATREQGWRVERTKRRHRRLIPPGPHAPIVIGAGTTNDRRGPWRFLADACRSGPISPGRPGGHDDGPWS
jgi:hypothetical protein